MKRKTRHMYGKGKDGRLYDLGDCVEQALKANMMVKDWEKEMIELNPQLEIYVQIEEV